MSLDDFINQNIYGKIGRLLEIIIGKRITCKLNQHLYDIFGNDFTGWDYSGDLPDPEKIKIIREYHTNNPHCNIFVETGTFFGYTTFALKEAFKTCHTIEVDPWLFKKAKNKFNHYTNCICYHGDSTKILPSLLPTIDAPILYWLDAHYSGGITWYGDTKDPIMIELESILKHKHILNSVILIDDARTLNVDDIFALIRKTGLKITVEKDIIRVTP